MQRRKRIGGDGLAWQERRVSGSGAISSSMQSYATDGVEVGGEWKGRTAAYGEVRQGNLAL
jgi:hypothetical protein